MKLRIVALALISLLLSAPAVRAQSTWSGAVDSDYGTAGNWDTPPGSGANLVFTSAASTFTVNLGSAQTAGNINLNTGTYTFTGTGAPVFTLNGNIVTFINADFAASLGSFSLSSGSRTMAVLPGQSLSFHTAVTGLGSLYKDGYGTLNLYGANTYTGGTTVNAGGLNLDGATASLSHASVNTVVSGPSAGAPTLYIYNGASVTDNEGHIGVGAGAHGSVSLDSGSTWTNNGYLYVGEAGVGTLAATSSSVTATNTSIGNNNGGTGTVTLTNGSLTNSVNLYVGSEGAGYLDLQGSSTVQNVVGSVGNNAGGTGTVTINGSGSTWTNSGNLYVGASGTGTLNLYNGDVSANNLIVGNTATGIGTVNLAGGNALLAVDGNLVLGGASGASGTLLAGGGAVVTSDLGKIGEAAGSTGVAKIHGALTSWSTAGDIYVGNGGNGSLYVYDGANVSVGSGGGTLNLGHSSGGIGDLYLGYTGSGYAAGGIINAANILTGASGGTGTLHLGTTNTITSAYYLTKTGLTGGANVAISGPTAVTNDAGYNIVRGNNTYTGPTDIYSGTLVAGQPFTATSPLGTTGTVTVHSGGTLAAYNAIIANPLLLMSGSRLIGSTSSGGSIASATIGNGVTLSPGFDSADPVNGPLGSLSFGTLTLGQGGILEIKVKNAGPLTNNSVSVSSLLQITTSTGNASTLKLISLDNSYNVGALGGGVSFNTTASLPFLAFTSQSGNLVLGDNLLLDTSMFDTGLGVANNFTLTELGNVYYLNFTPVPEPSTYALLALGLFGTGFAAWRKRRTN